MGILGNRDCQWVSRSVWCLVFKTIPRSLMVETVGMVWVLGGLLDGRV